MVVSSCDEKNLVKFNVNENSTVFTNIKLNRCFSSHEEPQNSEFSS